MPHLCRDFPYWFPTSTGTGSLDSFVETGWDDRRGGYASFFLRVSCTLRFYGHNLMSLFRPYTHSFYTNDGIIIVKYPKITRGSCPVSTLVDVLLLVGT